MNWQDKYENFAEFEKSPDYKKWIEEKLKQAPLIKTLKKNIRPDLKEMGNYEYSIPQTISMETIKKIKKDFEYEIIEKYSVNKHFINEFEEIFILEDSLILYIGILEKGKYCEEVYGNPKNNASDTYMLKVEELNYNSINFKHNHTQFLKKIEKEYKIPTWDAAFIYTKFAGFTRLEWDVYKGDFVKKGETLVKIINKKLPELKIKERYDSWEGLPYYFIVIESISRDGKKGMGVYYSLKKPHTYILSKCKEWIKEDFCIGNMNAIYNQSSYYPINLEEALFSWGIKNKQKILEENLTYFYLQKNFKDKDEAMKFAYEISENTTKGIYEKLPRFSYLKPENRWISEELTYKIVKKIYKDFNIIYQHRPFFLRSQNGGQMSYDIFIAHQNIAIEYQGKQHFEPVEFFGGEKSFLATQERDKLKKKISEENGIKLIYINYWEDITEELIKSKINAVIDSAI